MTTSDTSARERVRGGLARLGVSRAEVAALALLALFGIAALGIVWWAQTPGGGVGGADGGVAEVVDGGARVEGTQGGTAEEPVAGAGGIVVEGAADHVVVHVAGLVGAPGLHRLPAGARVADAIEAAGGALPEAWLDALNLARPLTDGEQLLVPGRPADPGTAAGAASGEGAGVTGDGGGLGGTGVVSPLPGGIRPDGTLDLNRATAAELETLPGIGPVMAERIVEHRAAQGPFTAVGQLRDVRGIGEKTFQALVDLVSL